LGLFRDLTLICALISELSPLYRLSKSKTYFEQCFDVIGILGNGSFGQVLHVRSKDTGEEYAVKRALRTFESSGKRYRQLQEALNHETVSPHPNIVQFERAWEERGRFYIQTELCGANLHDYRAHYGPLVESEQWTVFEDTLKALERLHSEDMLHLDVKPSNIYLSLDKRSCKLGDFGLAINLKKVAADWADDGDKNYMAPELLNESPTTAADMFSLGITMLEVSVAVDLHDEIMSLLNQSPEERPTATEILGRIGLPERQRAVFKKLEKVSEHTAFPQLFNVMRAGLWDSKGAFR
uniref:non-specific serine/threonine protein kinase n=1 Tax=Haemonchus placei TaxID=6290 RepID=A0A158QP11_HAEPC